MIFKHTCTFCEPSGRGLFPWNLHQPWWLNGYKQNTGEAMAWLWKSCWEKAWVVSASLVLLGHWHWEHRAGMRPHGVPRPQVGDVAEFPDDAPGHQVVVPLLLSATEPSQPNPQTTCSRDKPFPLLCCSVTQSRLSFNQPMGCTTSGFPVLYHLPECAQTQCPLSQWCHLCLKRMRWVGWHLPLHTESLCMIKWFF